MPPDIHATVSAERLRRGRTIIVGDIHGCLDEFRALLKEAEYDKAKDVLILAGDLVNKGPSSAEVRIPHLLLLDRSAFLPLRFPAGEEDRWDPCFIFKIFFYPLEEWFSCYLPVYVCWYFGISV